MCELVFETMRAIIKLKTHWYTIGFGTNFTWFVMSKKESLRFRWDECTNRTNIVPSKSNADRIKSAFDFALLKAQNSKICDNDIYQTAFNRNHLVDRPSLSC